MLPLIKRRNAWGEKNLINSTDKCSFWTCTSARVTPTHTHMHVLDWAVRTEEGRVCVRDTKLSAGCVCVCVCVCSCLTYAFISELSLFAKHRDPSISILAVHNFSFLYQINVEHVSKCVCVLCAELLQHSSLLQQTMKHPYVCMLLSGKKQVPPSPPVLPKSLCMKYLQAYNAAIRSSRMFRPTCMNMHIIMLQILCCGT